MGIDRIVSLPPIPLTHPGPYDFVVFADGLEIDRQQFRAASPPEEPDHGEAEETDEGED